MLLSVMIASGAGLPPTDWLHYLRDGGILGVLMVVVIGAIRKWWVPGWLYAQALEESTKREQDALADRDEWKDLALSGMHLAERQVGVLERSTSTTVTRKRKRTE